MLNILCTEYAKKLNENNVYHEFLLFKGVCHGFYNKPGMRNK